MRRLVAVMAGVAIATAAIAFVVWEGSDSEPSAAPTPPRRAAGRLSCSGGDGLPTFSPVTLQRRGLPASTLFGDAPGKALRTFLSGRPGSSFPLTPDGAFNVISRTPAGVLYLERTGTDFAYAAASKQGGKWKVRGWGGCAPRYQGSISFQIAVVPDPAASTFPVQYLTGGKCNGPTHELLALDHVAVHETADTVEVTLYREEDIPPPGWKPPKNTACDSGGVMERTTISLSNALGSRHILDAGAVPAAPAAIAPTAY